MHTTEVGTANVPAFLTKLWKLVEDPMYNDLICWSSNGRSFIIKNQSQFSKELLPMYFKHNNMASFIRQLNMYGFRKLTSIEHSGLKSDKDEMEFFHQYFLKGQESYLEYIKRKVATTGKMSSNGLDDSFGTNQNNNGGIGDQHYKDILMDVKAIRDRQDSAENCLVQMQRENTALWREVATLRHKHSKQQQIVERLIHFLVTLVQNQRVQGASSANKRKMPLMIDGADGITSAKRVAPKDPTAAIGGPVIHDVTNDVIDAELDACANNNPIISISGESKMDNERPRSVLSNFVASPLNQFATDNSSMDSFDTLLNTNVSNQVVTSGHNNTNEGTVEATYGNLSEPPTPLAAPGTPLTPGTPVTPLNLATNEDSLSTLDTPNVVVSQMSPIAIPTTSAASGMSHVQQQQQPHKSPSPNGLEMVAAPDFTKEYFTDLVDGVDTELSWLQDQLSSGSISIDPTALLGLFSNEGDPVSTTSGLPLNAVPVNGTVLPAVEDVDPILADLLETPTNGQVHGLDTSDLLNGHRKHSPLAAE